MYGAEKKVIFFLLIVSIAGCVVSDVASKVISDSDPARSIESSMWVISSYYGIFFSFPPL